MVATGETFVVALSFIGRPGISSRLEEGPTPSVFLWDVLRLSVSMRENKDGGTCNSVRAIFNLASHWAVLPQILSFSRVQKNRIRFYTRKMSRHSWTQAK